MQIILDEYHNRSEKDKHLVETLHSGSEVLDTLDFACVDGLNYPAAASNCPCRLLTTATCPMSSGLSADFGAHPKPLPSLPPSPTTSEDLSRAPAWIDLEEEDQTTPQKKKDKGKGKQVANPDVEEGAESGEISEEEEARNSYPPTTEDTSETRRIEEVSFNTTHTTSYHIMRPSILTATSIGRTSGVGS